MARQVSTESRRKQRFCGQGNEVIDVADVNQVISIMANLINLYSQSNRSVRNELDTFYPSCLNEAEQIFQQRKKQIMAIKQDLTDCPLFTLANLRDLHVSLVAYTIDDPLYLEFNKETRDLLSGKLHWSNYAYPAFLVHLWAGTTYIYGSPRHHPQKLYRGMTNYPDRLRPRRKFAFPSIVSTTASFEVAMDFSSTSGAVFVIQSVDTMLHAIGLNLHSAVSDEEEFLLAPTHEFVIESIGYTTWMGERRTMITCRVVRTMDVPGL